MDLDLAAMHLEIQKIMGWLSKRMQLRLLSAMKHTIASLGRSGKDVCIKDLGIPCTCFNSFMKLILNV